MAVDVSIIVPVFNEISAIRRCVEAIKQYESFAEVIFVDGGSCDGTRQFLTDHQCYCMTAQRGRAAQMNAGAAIAKGEYLVFLHADTLLPETFRVSDLLGAQWGFFRVSLSGSQMWFRWIELGINFRAKLTGIGTGDQTLFMTRQLFNSIKGYAAIPLMEDVELCQRLKRLCSPTFLSASVSTSSRRWEKSGVLKTVIKMWCIQLAFQLGVSSERLWSWYYKK